MQTITNPFIQMPGLLNVPSGAKAAPLAGLDGVFSSMLLSLLAPAPQTTADSTTVLTGLIGAMPNPPSTAGSETSLPVGLLLQPETKEAGSTASISKSPAINRLVKFDTAPPITSGSRQILATAREPIPEDSIQKSDFSIMATARRDEETFNDAPTIKSAPSIVTYASLPELDGALVITLPADSVIPVSVPTPPNQSADSTLSTQHSGLVTPHSLLSISAEAIREALVQNGLATPAAASWMNIETVTESRTPAAEVSAQGLDRQLPNNIKKDALFTPVLHSTNQAESNSAPAPAMSLATVLQSTDTLTGGLQIQVPPEALLFSEEGGVFLPVSLVSESPEGSQSTRTALVQLPLTLVGQSKESPMIISSPVNVHPQDAGKSISLAATMVSECPVNNNTATTISSISGQGKTETEILTTPVKPVESSSLLFLVRNTVSASEQSWVRSNMAIQSPTVDIQHSIPNEGRLAANIKTPAQNPAPLAALHNILQHEGREMNVRIEQIQVSAGSQILTVPEGSHVTTAPLPLKSIAVHAPPANPQTPVAPASVKDSISDVPASLIKNNGDAPLETVIPIRPASIPSAPVSSTAASPAPVISIPPDNAIGTSNQNRVTDPKIHSERPASVPVSPVIQNNTPATLRHATEAMKADAQSIRSAGVQPLSGQSSLSPSIRPWPQVIIITSDAPVPAGPVTLRIDSPAVLAEPAVYQSQPAPVEYNQSTGAIPREVLIQTAPRSAIRNEAITSQVTGKIAAVQAEPVIQESRIATQAIQSPTAPSTLPVARVSGQPAPVTLNPEVQNILRPAEMPILENTAPFMDRRPNITVAPQTTTQPETLSAPAGKPQTLLSSEPAHQEPVVVLRSETPARTVALQVANTTVSETQVESSSPAQIESPSRVPSRYFAQHPPQTQETSPAAVRGDNTKAAESRERTAPVSNETVNLRPLTRNIQQPAETVTSQPIREEEPAPTNIVRARDLNSVEARTAETEARRPFATRPVDARSHSTGAASEQQSGTAPAENRPARSESLSSITREAVRNIAPEPRLNETRRVADLPRLETARSLSTPESGRETRSATFPARKSVAESTVEASRPHPEFNAGRAERSITNPVTPPREAMLSSDELNNTAREISAPPPASVVKAPESLAPVSHPAAVQEAAPPERISPVRVSETAAPSQTVFTDEAEVTQQIVRKASLEVSRGRSEMQIRLEPESLGTVRLRITVENGAVTARVVAENPETHRLLERNAPLLRASLEQSGLSVERIEVAQTHAGERQGHTGSQHNQQQNNPQQGSQPGFQQNAGGETHRESHQSRQSYPGQSHPQHHHAREELQETPRSWMASRKFGRREYTA